MLQVPAFPIRCKSKSGDVFKAHFKKIGDPKNIRVVLTYKNKTQSLTIPAPKGEVNSWGGIAVRAFAEAFPPAPEETNEPLPLLQTVPTNEPNTRAAGRVKILSKVRSSSPPGIILVKDARSDALYRTAQQADPLKHYMCRFLEQKDSRYFSISVYFSSIREWKTVDVLGDYKLTLHENQPEEDSMPTATKSKPASKAAANNPAAKTPKGLTVYEAWGQAFHAYGSKPSAPKNIVAFMEKQFPGRKTNWAKWVNNVRNSYNAGRLPGVQKPKDRIPPYR